MDLRSINQSVIAGGAHVDREVAAVEGAAADVGGSGDFDVGLAVGDGDGLRDGHDGRIGGVGVVGGESGGQRVVHWDGRGGEDEHAHGEDGHQDLQMQVE